MSKLVNAQQRIADLLVADAMFSTATPTPAGKVAVVLARKGDVLKKMQEALSNVGLGVIIRQPIGDFNGEANKISLSLSFILAISEHTVKNNTGKTAEDVWEKAALLLHYQPLDPALRMAKNLYLMLDKKCLTPATPNPGSLYNGYFLKLNANMLLP